MHPICPHPLTPCPASAPLPPQVTVKLADKAALDVYGPHPQHAEVKAIQGPMVHSIFVVDCTVPFLIARRGRLGAVRSAREKKEERMLLASLGVIRTGLPTALRYR